MDDMDANPASEFHPNIKYPAAFSRDTVLEVVILLAGGYGIWRSFLTRPVA